MQQVKTVGIQDLPSEFKEKVHKRIEHYIGMFELKLDSYDELSVVCKVIHKKDKDAKPIYELNVNLICGSKVYHGHAEEYSPIDAVNSALETVAQTVITK